jgi:hypothetical protein
MFERLAQRRANEEENDKNYIDFEEINKEASKLATKE